VDQFTHEDHLKERLSFLTELYTLYKIKLTNEHIGILWEILAATAIRSNSEIFFKWLNEQLSFIGTNKYTFLSYETLDYFFTSFVLNPANNYGVMEIEGFNLFKSLFKIINEKSHKIQIMNVIRKKNEHETISSHGSTLISNTYSNVNQNKEFILYVHPDQLKGIETVWRIMVECNNIIVTADCMIFIGNIYQNVSDVIQDQRMEIEEDLVKKSILQIKNLRAEIHKPIPEHFGEEQINHVNYKNQFYQSQIDKN